LQRCCRAGAKRVIPVPWYRGAVRCRCAEVLRFGRGAEC
jgi:hypothetical protein